MIPTGTVVFLFSDIEGSTVRWEAHGKAMREALRKHDDTLRRAIVRHNGYVFKTIGDAFCAAFQDVRGAVQAAVKAQREIAALDWKSVGGLRVRMALHAGDAEERDGDYFGPTVNRVARLLATGHGGQMLLTGIAADLVGGHLPPDVSLRSLGTHRLKDLERPEHVFQIVAPDLPATFSPLRSLEATPNNLPHQRTSFIGREEDLEHVGSLLHSAALVTIIGTGGVGKTRLALQAAADALDGAEDGAWFVDFAPIDDPHLIESTILSALGVKQDDDRPALDVLAGYLQNRIALLLLDNCEHVIDGAARVCAAILARCPHITILATSREPLNVPGERIYRLPSLGLGESVRLFEERAHSAVPSFKVSDENRRAVEEVCTRLDGIALAIELAAPRLRVLSVEELLRRLNERFRLLTGGSRTALPRHQTMRALIDWSYELLSDEEKSLFRRLAVFRGGFALDSAVAVCSGEVLDDWAIFDLLTSLVDKSLIVAGAEQHGQRYRLLESIRQYAQERLDEAGEGPLISRRYASFFADLAQKAYEEWDSDPRPHWLEHLRPDLDNFRSALDWTLEERNDPHIGARIASSASPIFLRLSLLGEGIRWGETALRSNGELDARIAARLHYGLSMLHNNQAALREAMHSAERAVVLYREAGDGRGLTRALSQIAQQYVRQGRRDEALTYAAEAIERARAANDKRLLAGTLQRCAYVFEANDIEQARKLFKECVDIFRSLGRDDETARALNWWAEAEGAAGHLARATELGLQALKIAGDDIRLFVLTSNVVSNMLALGRVDRSAPYAREALRLAAQTRHPIILPMSIAYLSIVIARERPREAARLLGYAKARFAALEWESSKEDRETQNRLLQELTETLGASEVDALSEEGAAWDEDRAVLESSNV